MVASCRKKRHRHRRCLFVEKGERWHMGKLLNVFGKATGDSSFESVLMSQLSVEEKELVRKLGLDDPKEFVKFLIKSFWAELDTIHKTFEMLQCTDLINTICKIKNAKNTLQNRYEDDETKHQNYLMAFNDLNKGLEELFAKTLLYIDRIREIDQMGKLDKIYHFRTIYNDARKYNLLARRLLEATFLGVSCLYVYSDILHIDVGKGIESKFREFIAKILENDTCTLMDDYDEEQNNFWLEVPESVSSLLVHENVKVKFLVEKDLEKVINDEDVDFDDFHIIFE